MRCPTSIATAIATRAPSITGRTDAASTRSTRAPTSSRASTRCRKAASTIFPCAPAPAGALSLPRDGRPRPARGWPAGPWTTRPTAKPRLAPGLRGSALAPMTRNWRDTGHAKARSAARQRSGLAVDDRPGLGDAPRIAGREVAAEIELHVLDQGDDAP